MSFLVALVGRANVGKSMIFNRLTASKDALVANFEGLTRDRKYGKCKLGKGNFALVDTGGLEIDATGVVAKSFKQVEKAITEADLVGLVVDASVGLNAHDEIFAEYLRRNGKQVFLIINKIDGINQDLAVAEFASLAIADIFCISAKNNRGMVNLANNIDYLWQDAIKNGLAFKQLGFELEEQDQTEYEKYLANKSNEDKEDKLSICLVGRPNVGKSTLINALLGEERQVVFDEPGTTRDAIEIEFSKGDKHYTLIDTAGIRRRKQVKQSIEKFSIQKTKTALNMAGVAILLIEADLGLVDQDVALLNLILKTGKPCVIAVNKSDKLNKTEKKSFEKRLKAQLHFADFIQIRFISAVDKVGLTKLLQEAEKAYRSANMQFNKRELNDWLEMLLRENPTPKYNNRHIKLRYIHQISTHPPHLLIHGKKTDELPKSYKSYIQNNFYKLLNLVGTPLVIEYRTDDNPYVD